MKLKHLFGSVFLTPKEKVENILKKYQIENYTINTDLSVDVDGNIDFRFADLKIIPAKFGKVTGSFNCSNQQLTTLQGCPKEVGGDFYCYNNNLTSLEGAPKEVGGDFSCENNKLETLQGCPRDIGGEFNCSKNPHLKSLDGVGNVGEQIISDIS